MWTRASSFTCASAATAAAWPTVEWPVSAARWTSSSAKLASWTSSSASAAAATVCGEGAVSPVMTTVRPARLGPITCSGRTVPSLPATSSPRCSAAKAGPSATPAAFAAAGSKRPGRCGLDQGVAVGAHAVARFEGLHLVAVVGDRVARLQLDQLQREAEPADQRLEHTEEVAQARRPVDEQRLLAVGQVVALQQPRQAEDVIGVEVRQVDLVDLGQPQRALHLPLRPFAAVEQQPVPATRHQHARRRAPRRGHRAAGAEEDHVEIHRRASLRGRALARYAGKSSTAPPWPDR